MAVRRTAPSAVFSLVSLALAFAAAGCVTIAPSGADATESPKGTPNPSAGAVVASPIASPEPGQTKKPRRTRAPRTASPVATATVTLTAPPTDTPTAPPTDMPTDTPTAALPTDTPAPPATSGGLFTFRIPPDIFESLPILQPSDPRLDYTQPANYGEINLATGFSPDPYSVGMTAGGSVNVAYLGGSCTGYATSPPDLQLNFTGTASLLRLYFVGAGGDSTIVVNDPYGNFYCVDDSFGTINPTIDFNNPSAGSYDIWVGAYAAGTLVSGTFYVSELSTNHP